MIQIYEVGDECSVGSFKIGGKIYGFSYKIREDVLVTFPRLVKVKAQPFKDEVARMTAEIVKNG